MNLELYYIRMDGHCAANIKLEQRKTLHEKLYYKVSSNNISYRILKCIYLPILLRTYGLINKF